MPPRSTGQSGDLQRLDIRVLAQVCQGLRLFQTRLQLLGRLASQFLIQSSSYYFPFWDLTPKPGKFTSPFFDGSQTVIFVFQYHASQSLYFLVVSSRIDRFSLGGKCLSNIRTLSPSVLLLIQTLILCQSPDIFKPIFSQNFCTISSCSQWLS